MSAPAPLAASLAAVVVGETSARPVTHGGLGGPLDTFVELGLPILLFLGLYWWSARKPKRARPEADPGLTKKAEQASRTPDVREVRR